MTALILDRIDSPLGEILHVSDETGVSYALDFAEYAERMRTLLARYAPGRALRDGRASAMRERLARYFDGDAGAFEGLPVHAGGTALQNAVWSQLRAIPAGETLSYGALAQALGRPSAVRAVASANARNPIAIVVPCHRIIGRDGGLTGYAGGLWRKAWLLRHEMGMRMAP